MHEDIMRFPSRWFYHDELEAAPEVKYRGILDFDTPVSWIDTSELDLQEKAVAEGTGRLNRSRIVSPGTEKLYGTDRNPAYFGGAYRFRGDITLSGTSPLFKASVEKRAVLSSLPSPDHRAYG